MAEKPVQDTNFQHIVRVANVDLPGEKQIRIALLKIKGIGFNLADAICAAAHVTKTAKTGNLKADQVKRLTEVIINPLAAGIPVWMFNHQKDIETAEDKHLITG